MNVSFCVQIWNLVDYLQRENKRIGKCSVVSLSELHLAETWAFCFSFKNILKFLEKSQNMFIKVSKTEFALAANIFESGPMPTPWKILDGTPLLPSCKLG